MSAKSTRKKRGEPPKLDAAVDMAVELLEGVSSMAVELPLPEGVKSFVISVPTGTRNDITRSLGYEFEPLSDMLVTHAGRPVSGSMNSTHRIYIWEVSTQQLIATADVRPNSALENGFRVAELGTAVTLKAGEKYRIVSSETNGGDLWFNVDQPGTLTVSDDARITTAVSTATDANGTYPGSVRDAGENKGFVGVTFFYRLINDTEPDEPDEPDVPDIPIVIKLPDVRLSVKKALEPLGIPARAEKYKLKPDDTEYIVYFVDGEGNGLYSDNKPHLRRSSVSLYYVTLSLNDKLVRVDEITEAMEKQGFKATERQIDLTNNRYDNLLDTGWSGFKQEYVLERFF